MSRQASGSVGLLQRSVQGATAAAFFEQHENAPCDEFIDENGGGVLK
jgi:hypothetical protein